MAEQLVLPDELKQAIELYSKNQSTLKDLIAARKQYAPNIDIMVQLPLSRITNHDDKFVIYDRISDRNPKYPKGDNSTRTEFTWHPHYNKKGKMFQDLKHKIMIEAVNYMHKKILNEYDMDAYVYDDPRLQNINGFFRGYIHKNFREAMFKTEVMNKLLDIFMFLQKEDIYYRARFMDMFNTVPRCELTEGEKENIQRWH